MSCFCGKNHETIDHDQAVLDSWIKAGEALESQLSQVQGEHALCHFLNDKLVIERDSLKAENEKLNEKLKQLDCEFDIDHSTMQDKVNALQKEVQRLKEENERLKACSICHKPFLGNRPHVNCGDMQGSAADFQGSGE